MKGITIGIDPGLVNTGISILKFQTKPVRVKPINLYTINTKPSKNKRNRRSTDTRDRLETIFLGMDSVTRPHLIGHRCELNATDITTIGLEYPLSGMRNSKTMAVYGVLLAMSWVIGAPAYTYEFVPQDLKRWATGKASAPKEKIKEVLIEKFPKFEKMLDDFPKGQHEHLCDATVCGILAAHEVARTEKGDGI